MMDHGHDHGPGLTPFSRLMALLRCESRDLWAVLVYAIAVGALSLATPVAVQSLVNSVAFGALLQPLLILTLLLLCGLSLHGLLRAFQAATVELLQQRFFARTALGLSHHQKDPAHVTRFFEVVTVQKSMAGLLVDGVGLALQTFMGLCVLAFYHPLLLAFDLVLLLCLAFVIFGLGRGATRTAIAESRAKYAVADWLEEELAITDSITSGRTAALVETYLGHRRAHFKIVLRQVVGLLALYALASAALMGIGGALVIARQLTIGQLVAAELIVGAVLASMSKFGKHLESYYDLLAALDKLGHLAHPPLELPGHEAPTAQVAVAQVPSPRSAWSLARALVTGLFVCLVLLALLPWVQNVRGSGRVVAYAPLDRQQNVEAPIEGRIGHWLVREGSHVQAGELLVEISDNDPALLQRLHEERDAVQARLAAAQGRVRAIEDRVRELGEARGHGVAGAEARVRMAQDRLRAAEQAEQAARAAEQTARLQRERQQALFEKGLTSRRTLELAELDSLRTTTETARAEAALRAARAEVGALGADRSRVHIDVSAAQSDARAQAEAARSEVANAQAELARIEVRLARQRTQAVKAPRAGTILRLLVSQGTELVKAGDALAILVPDTEQRAAELWLDGNDVPLVTEGRKVRLQFEGWPAVQFSGWPSVAVGTFAGQVALIDSTDDGKGRFRVLVLPDPESREPWPSTRYLRQGVRVNGWVLLNRVRLGYELWRQFNGFPPVVAPSEPFASDKDAGKKGDK